MTSDAQPRYTNPHALTWEQRCMLGTDRRPRDIAPQCWDYCYGYQGHMIVLTHHDSYSFALPPAMAQAVCIAAHCRCPCHHPSVEHVFTYGEWERLLKLRTRAQTLTYEVSGPSGQEGQEGEQSA